MDYLQTTGDRLHDLELDRILARLRTLESQAGAATITTVPAAVQAPALLSAGVRSITPGGGAQISNDVVLAVAGPISLAQSGQTITLTVTHSPAATVTEVASGGAVGTAVTYAREDHVHKGVHKITGSADAFGDVVFTGAGVTQAGNTFTFSAGGASVVPTNVLMISPGSASISWAVPLALTEFNGLTIHRSKHDLTNATQARIAIFRTTGPLVTVSPTIFAEYSTNGGSTWASLDGASGPSVTYVYSSAVQVSAWVILMGLAKADVLLRISASGGDGAQSVPFGSLYVQVK